MPPLSRIELFEILPPNDFTTDSFRSSVEAEIRESLSPENVWVDPPAQRDVDMTTPETNVTRVIPSPVQPLIVFSTTSNPVGYGFFSIAQRTPKENTSIETLSIQACSNQKKRRAEDPVDDKPERKRRRKETSSVVDLPLNERLNVPSTRKSKLVDPVIKAQKHEERKMKNRQSAQRSRERKKVLTAFWESKIASELARKEFLRSALEKVQKDNEELIREIDNHRKSISDRQPSFIRL